MKKKYLRSIRKGEVHVNYKKKKKKKWFLNKVQPAKIVTMLHVHGSNMGWIVLQYRTTYGIDSGFKAIWCGVFQICASSIIIVRIIN